MIDDVRNGGERTHEEFVLCSCVPEYWDVEVPGVNLGIEPAWANHPSSIRMCAALMRLGNVSRAVSVSLHPGYGGMKRYLKARIKEEAWKLKRGHTELEAVLEV